jgi:hypothetical protein
MDTPGSLVSIVTSYRLDDRGFRVWVPVRSRMFTSHIMRDWFMTYSVTYQIGTEGSLLGGKMIRVCKADNSPPVIIEAKKMWIYTPAPPYIFIA